MAKDIFSQNKTGFLEQWLKRFLFSSCEIQTAHVQYVLSVEKWLCRKFTVRSFKYTLCIHAAVDKETEIF